MLVKMQDIIREITDEDEIEITEQTNFREDLDLDSLDMFELIMNFEDEFKVKISPEELKKISTVSDVIQYIKSQQ